jgi:cytochrome c5
MVLCSVERSKTNHAWLWGVVAVAWLAACADTPEVDQAGGTPGGSQMTFTDELLLASAKVALPPPGVGPQDLPDPNSAGAEYTQKYCVACHELPSPGTHSVTDWPVVLRRMWLRMDQVGLDFDVPIPTAAERVMLIRYLIDNALQVSEATLPEGPGRELFAETCSKCHDLPDPKQHGPDDWAAVVLRMMQRMEEMLEETLQQSEFQQIVLYVESASRQ